MKVFKNERTSNNNELPIRKGSIVPDGAVNLAWYKSPDLSPKNNLVVIDSTRFEGPEKSGKFLAYANTLGVLEDEYGNQVWPEEFPVIGDQFFNPDSISSAEDFMPYVHISRHFHLDYPGLDVSGSLTELSRQPSVRVVDSNNKEYLNNDGEPAYKVFVSSLPVTRPESSRESAYRLWAFLDMDPREDELFLVYNKVEIDQGTNDIRDLKTGYREPINAKEYYHYLPEETEVLDRSADRRRVYSTSPIDLKDQVIGRSQPQYKGWQVQVPKKAVPDPRNYELFRWRIACEYSREIEPTETTNINKPTKIKVGVATFNSSSAAASQTRANYLFLQLNKSSFNTGGIDFVNPLKDGETNLSKEQAGYWHVPLNEISIGDLSQFDILVWAPSSPSVDIAPSILQKIEYFTETHGGTFIIETSSRVDLTGLPGVAVSPRLANLLDNTKVRVKASGTDYHEHPPVGSNASNYGIYKTWPPITEDIFTDNSHSSELLKNLNFLGGWDLDTESELTPSAYKNMSNATSLFFQYMEELDEEDWEVVVDSEIYSDIATPSTDRFPVLARKKFTSGGSLIFSTACFFEDHILDPTTTLVDSTFQVDSLSSMPEVTKSSYLLAVSSTSMEGEIKLRLNIAMLSTAFRPAPNLSDSSELGFSGDAERHSITLYSDWQSDWVINAHNDVLSSEEKAKFNFVLLPKSPEDSDPVWMKVLSEKTFGEIMDARVNEVNPELLTLSGVRKRYTLLVTNSSVETHPYNLITDDTLPAVWTYSFSPPFTVPVDLTPYVIREEMIAGVGVGDGKRLYPAKPYKVQSTASYVSTETQPSSLTVTATVSGKARRVYSIPSYDIITELPPISRVDGWYSNKLLRWSSDQNTTLGNYYPFKHFGGIKTGMGVESFTDRYYVKQWTNNWAYMGVSGTYSVNRNTRGTHVKSVQRLLNQFIFFGIIPGPYVREDGFYGSVTAAKIRSYQIRYGAIYVDGIIDAETWSLLAYGLIRLSNIPNWLNGVRSTVLGDWANRALNNVQLRNSSSSPTNTSYFRHSWATNGPSSIRDNFIYRFDPNYSDADINGNFDIYELWIKPGISASKNNDINIDWLDVRNNLSFVGYNPSAAASHGAINVVAKAGQYLKIPFSRRRANSVSFRVHQWRSAGWGTARTYGLNDVAVMARTYIPNTAPPAPNTEITTIPGSSIMEELDIEYSYSFNLKTGVPQTIPTIVKNGTFIDGVKVETISGSHNSELDMYPSAITEFRLTDCTITPAGKAGFVTITPIASTVASNGATESFSLLYNDTLQSVTEPNYISGPKIGDGSTPYYVKTLGGSVEQFPRSYGWVSKDQGVLLITDQNGSPAGFPLGSPRAAGKELNFARLVMDSWETDQTLHYGFYDALRNEWLENKNGEPDISYYDYVRRGPQNVYMAVQTTYEIDGQSNLPPASDPVTVPFKVAMPVYGVKTRNESSVKLRNPSEELGHTDIWPILIGTGGFSKQIFISNKLADSSTSYLKNYGNKTLTAHYILRDGYRGPWSDILGRPYRDNIDERPRLLSDSTIMVNNSPIASVQEPTLDQLPSDPVKPFFTVHRRETFDGPWVEVPLWEIKEYNLNKGTITLANPLATQDNRLVKVSYISRDYTYQYKFGNGKKINLNPYIMQLKMEDSDHLTVLDKPLYVYLKPSFIVDNETRNVITEMHQDAVVGISTSNTIFNPLQADYDPMAYRLGTIFVTSSMDISHLTLLDTRVRGGGVKHHLGLQELDTAAKSYWDSPTEQPYSYQRGGFVIIQLPQEITEDFASEEDLRSVIDRNVTAGVAYELQNYAGEPLKDFTGSK
jgi:hypothetical protein